MGTFLAIRLTNRATGSMMELVRFAQSVLPFFRYCAHRSIGPSARHFRLGSSSRSIPGVSFVSSIPNSVCVARLPRRESPLSEQGVMSIEIEKRGSLIPSIVRLLHSF